MVTYQAARGIDNYIHNSMMITVKFNTLSLPTVKYSNFLSGLRLQTVALSLPLWLQILNSMSNAESGKIFKIKLADNRSHIIKYYDFWTGVNVVWV